MTAWYKKNPAFFEEERRELAKASPLMGLSIMRPGFPLNRYTKLETEAVVAHGTHQVAIPNSHSHLEYKITLLTPPNFPDRPPVMFCDDPKLPWRHNPDRHVFGQGQACLAVNAEIQLHWPPGSTLVKFLERLVDPWIVWQAYYDAHDEPPPWGARDHGREGIFDFYREQWGQPLPGAFQTKAFMELLAMKKTPKGHHPCPCGNGKKLRDCHLPLVAEKWSALDRRDVKKDLEIVKVITE